jgi:hypothetical protein
MTIESATYISDLDDTYPAGTDQKKEGDNHIRLLKTVLRATFPNIAGAMTLSHTQLNALADALTAPSGTKMFFNQTSAPTGWTKETGTDNAALRLVSGTVSSGGSSNFTSVFGSSVSTGSHTLTASEMPSHTHTGTTGTESAAHTHGDSGFYGFGSGSGSSPYAAGFNSFRALSLGTESASHTHSFTTSSAGSGGGHTHSMSMNLKYVDTILATKD